ncbi:hypothetical protein K439DRAFT_1403866 [Ramaria rubella]|nr:hypothetical protein K439DRAFT_1403866 [Ramaria rubella]
MILPPSKRSTSKPDSPLPPQYIHERLVSSQPNFSSGSQNGSFNHQAGSTLTISSPRTTEPLSSIFTPSSPPVVVSPLRKASSSSQAGLGPSYRAQESEIFNDDEGVLYVAGGAKSEHNAPVEMRTRVTGANAWKHRQKDRSISTGPQRGAGETETEPDEPPRHLPTSRRLPTPPPLAPLTPLARITPLLFQAFRLLSVVPAFAGACYHIFNLYQPRGTHSRLDHFVCVLWALLTANQCLRLTTGLLTRWKAYYPPLPTLIRLLALQAICWPATQYTLVLFNHDRRPVICWAIIGSTTCVSRSIQIWVTSNLWGPSNSRLESKGVYNAEVKWGPRRWDWVEVGVKCALPMGVVYFVMAWAEALRRELSGC